MDRESLTNPIVPTATFKKNTKNISFDAADKPNLEKNLSRENSARAKQEYQTEEGFSFKPN